MSLALQTFSSLTEAGVALKSAGARYLGGGTLVVRAVNEGDISTTTLVRANDPALVSIDVQDDRVRLGASVTMAAIARDRRLSSIAAAASTVGGPAVRNMATIGGNLFAPAPYGDFAVALVALDATIHSTEGDTSIEAFLARRDHLGPGCIVVAVSFGLPVAGAFRFAKVSRIKPKGVSVLSIGAVLEQNADGVIKSARVGLGCMADRPMRANAAEQALLGQKLTADGIAAAVAAIGEGVSPITDPIASAWYRKEVLPVHFSRLMLG